MIKIFTKSSSSGCKQAQEWLNHRQIAFQTIRFKNLKLSDLVKILSLTDDGISEIQAKKTSRNLEEANHVRELINEAGSIAEVLQLLKVYPQCFKAPIIIDDNKIMIGYNDEEIRKFLPRSVKECYRYSS